MKEYQFEEIVFSLSVIIAILAYQNDLMWVCWVFVVKSIFDGVSAIVTAYRSLMKLQRTKVVVKHNDSTGG